MTPPKARPKLRDFLLMRAYPVNVRKIKIYVWDLGLKNMYSEAEAEAETRALCRNLGWHDGYYSLPNPRRCLDEVRQWCNATIGPQLWCGKGEDPPFDNAMWLCVCKSSRSLEPRYCFRREEDAILFKMRWW